MKINSYKRPQSGQIWYSSHWDKLILIHHKRKDHVVYESNFEYLIITALSNLKAQYSFIGNL